MERLYLLKDSRGRVVYEGNNQEDCASLRNTERSDHYMEYRFELMGDDFLNIKVIGWYNDAVCKPGEFRQISPTKWVQITGTRSLEGLSKLLQSKSQDPFQHSQTEIYHPLDCQDIFDIKPDTH